jgi:hypothetical protein
LKAGQRTWELPPVPVRHRIASIVQLGNVGKDTLDHFIKVVISLEKVSAYC